LANLAFKGGVVLTHNFGALRLLNLFVVLYAEGVGLSPSVGEVLGRMTQGGTIPRFVLTDGDPDPLQSLREEIAERLNSNWRDVRLRLLPTGVEHGSLMGIGLTCVKLYNEVNYEKRQAFFKGELTRDKMYEIDE
jgi:hypothetical protein